MQLLHYLKVNVLKSRGAPRHLLACHGLLPETTLSTLSECHSPQLASYQDYAANGGGDLHGFMMSSLNGPASTPLYFLVGAGGIMVVSLATSRKARQVTQTTVGLSAQSQNDEMFGSSRPDALWCATPSMPSPASRSTLPPASRHG